MLKGARALVDVCARVRGGEDILVVTDMKEKLSIAKAILSIAKDRGANINLLVMEPCGSPGQEPSRVVSNAMLGADVIFCIVSNSITHTYAVKNAAAKGARIIAMTDFREEMMVSGGIEADFEALRPICKKIAQVFEMGKTLHLTTPRGTNLVANIEGRRGNALCCIVEPGEFAPVPTVEANVSPVESSAEGVIVCDASIPYIGIGLIEEGVILKVEKGMVVEIEGGRQAKVLRENLASYKDKTVYNVAEIGVGLNPKCRMCGIMLEDEGVLSTAHVGIGTNITLGGSIKAPIHYDLIMWDPCVVVDGEVIISGKDIYV